MRRSPAPRYRRPHPDGQRGASLVELALALPLLVLLLAGIGDVGWMVWQRVQLQEATQEAALFAAYNPDDHDAVRARVAEASDFQVAPTDVTVECEGDRRVTVRIVHEHRPLLGLLPNLNLHLRTEVTSDVLVTADCEGPTP